MSIYDYVLEWQMSHKPQANFKLFQNLNAIYDIELDKMDGNSTQEKVYLLMNNINEIPKCKSCNKNLKFITYSIGYLTYCSKACKTVDMHDSGIIDHKQRGETFKKRYGVQDGKYSGILSKRRMTSMDRYDTNHPMQNTEVYTAYTNLIKEKYKVDNIIHIPGAISKMLHTSLRISNFKHLGYQGSYELDFIYHCEQLEILDDISNGISIDYFYDRHRKYLPDFYLKKQNLIIEIKSSWWYEKYKTKNLAKINECKAKGYNIIFIIDKDYTEFDNIVLQESSKQRP